MDVREKLCKIYESYINSSKGMEGKKISKVHNSWDFLSILFTDGTYTGFQTEDGGLDEAPTISICRPNVEDLYNVGVIGKELYKEWCDDNENKRKEERRFQWERLNKEFGKE